MAEGVVLRRLRAQLDDALQKVRSAQRNLDVWGDNSDDDLGDRRDYKDDLADARRDVERLREEIAKEVANPTPVSPRAKKFLPPQPPPFPESLVNVEFDLLNNYTLETVDTALAYIKTISSIKHLTREIEMIQAIVDVIADKVGGKALPVLWGTYAQGVEVGWHDSRNYPANINLRGEGWWITIQCDGWSLCFGRDIVQNLKHQWYFCEDGKEPFSLRTPIAIPRFDTATRSEYDLQRISDIQTKYLSRGALWRMCVFAYELKFNTREPFRADDADTWGREWLERRKRGTAPAAFGMYAPVISKTTTTTVLTVETGDWEKKEEFRCPSPTKKARHE